MMDIVCNLCLVDRFPLGPRPGDDNEPKGPCVACGAAHATEFYSVSFWDGPTASSVQILARVRLPVRVGDAEPSCWVTGRSLECPMLEFDERDYLQARANGRDDRYPTCRAFASRPTVFGDRILRSPECIDSVKNKP